MNSTFGNPARPQACVSVRTQEEWNVQKVRGSGFKVTGRGWGTKHVEQRHPRDQHGFVRRMHEVDLRLLGREQHLLGLTHGVVDRGGVQHGDAARRRDLERSKRLR